MPTRMTGSVSPLALPPAQATINPIRAQSNAVRTVRIRPHIRMRADNPPAATKRLLRRGVIGVA